MSVHSPPLHPGSQTKRPSMPHHLPPIPNTPVIPLNHQSLLYMPSEHGPIILNTRHNQSPGHPAGPHDNSTSAQTIHAMSQGCWNPNLICQLTTYLRRFKRPRGICSSTGISKPSSSLPDHEIFTTRWLQCARGIEIGILAWSEPGETGFRTGDWNGVGSIDLWGRLQYEGFPMVTHHKTPPLSYVSNVP